MNPKTNKFKELYKIAAEKIEQFNAIEAMVADLQGRLLQPDGTPVPAHWPVLMTGEHIVVKNYTFQVAYIGESYVVLEPVGPMTIDPEIHRE